MDVSTHLVFWVVAWCWMAVAFITAACAIIFGAKGLDRENKIGVDDQH